MKNYLLSKIKNLFPQDTRSSELASSMTLIAGVICLTLGLGGAVVVPSTAWLIIAFLAGLVQFTSLVFFEHCEKARVASSLLVGAFMFHLGIIHLDNSVFSYFSFMTMSIANIYAFLLNNQRVSWK
jgi:hypothetical protein